MIIFVDMISYAAVCYGQQSVNIDNIILTMIVGNHLPDNKRGEGGWITIKYDKRSTKH